MKLIKDLGIIKKTTRGYRYGIFECPICLCHTEKIIKDGLKAKLCSHSCYAKNRDRRGAYKSHVMVKKYKYLYMPDHPNAIGTKKYYVVEHRLVVENYIGRYLTENEVVHHINDNTLDNRIENLMIMTPSEHSSLHCNFRKNAKANQI